MLLRTVGTHDGTFHADEITACALLIIFDLIDRDKIIRTRNSKRLEECEYVCDVGGIYDPQSKKFDHHQNDYQGEMSSAGMVLLYLKDQKIISDKVYLFLEKTLIAGVDAHDNGKIQLDPKVCSFSQIVTNFTPIIYDSPNDVVMKAFLEALDFVCGHLKRMIERYHYMMKSREEVVQAMRPRQETLIFDKALPWMDVFFDLDGEHHPALFVIMPAGSHWKLRGIPPNAKERMKVRLPLPEKWAGLMDEELKQITQLSGAIFCHKGRFISVWETKDDALKAAHLILNHRER